MRSTIQVLVSYIYHHMKVNPKNYFLVFLQHLFDVVRLQILSFRFYFMELGDSLPRGILPTSSRQLPRSWRRISGASERIRNWLREWNTTCLLGNGDNGTISKFLTRYSNGFFLHPSLLLIQLCPSPSNSCPVLPIPCPIPPTYQPLKDCDRW